MPLMIFRIWCKECLNEYQIALINEPTETIKPIVCAICAEKIVDYYLEDEEE